MNDHRHLEHTSNTCDLDMGSGEQTLVEGDSESQPVDIDSPFDDSEGEQQFCTVAGRRVTPGPHISCTCILYNTDTSVYSRFRVYRIPDTMDT